MPGGTETKIADILVARVVFQVQSGLRIFSGTRLGKVMKDEEEIKKNGT